MSIITRLSNFISNRMPQYHQYYGKIYSPKYNLSSKFSNELPSLYNIEGNKLEVFFVSDNLSAHSPYLFSKYFYGDRYNFGLDTHLYSHNSIFIMMGKPIWKYAYFSESEAILPDDYNKLYRHSSLAKEFTYIFTFSEKMLNMFENARFAPFCTTPWYGTEKYGGVLSSEKWKVKERNISMMSSNQNISLNHKIRIQTAIYCKKNMLADTFGNFDGGSFVKDISIVFDKYRYSIIIENDIQSYYFTEKITNCFASMTIPIYYGASKIDSFFNMDGIITISSFDLHDIEALVKKCTEEEYMNRLPAVIDNYNRVLSYRSTWDLLYEKYMINRK